MLNPEDGGHALQNSLKFGRNNNNNDNRNNNNNNKFVNLLLL